MGRLVMTSEHTVRAYIKECLAQIPSSWKRGQATVSLVLSLTVAVASAGGWVIGAIPGWVPIVTAAAVAWFDIFTIQQFQVWKANMIRIEELENKLRRKVNDRELYEKISAFWDQGKRLKDELAPPWAYGPWSNEVEQCLREAGELDEAEGFRTHPDQLSKLRLILIRLAGKAKASGVPSLNELDEST